jgi:hypothetical protein
MGFRNQASKRCWAYVTAVMVAFALIVPLAGGAAANHGANADPVVINLDPPSDSAPTGTCNEFTVTATGANGQAAEGETVDIQAFQSDADTLEDLEIAFCQTPTASNLGGEQTAAGTGSGANPSRDCDDDAGRTEFGGTTANPTSPPGGFNDTGCPAVSGATGAGFESPAQIRDVCFTNANGQCTFGVTSNEPGTMTVIAFFERAGSTQNDVRDTSTTGDPFDQSTKTWTGGGAEAANTITCAPATDSNPEGSRHEFQCRVVDASGQALGGVPVSFDVTAGPNAEEVGPTPCGSTNDQGQTGTPNNNQTAEAGECGYTDNQLTNPEPGTVTVSSPPGTDTITAFVNQAARPGQQATAGADPGEPQTTIQKTWVGGGRNITCVPDNATADSGTVQTVVCTVTDVAGNPVPNVSVGFTETGPGRIITETPTLTNNAGEARAEVQTAENEIGQQTITGEILYDADNNPSTAPTSAGSTVGTQECEQPAGTGTNPPRAGNCTDTASYNWQPGDTTTDPQCDNGVDDDGDGFTDFPEDPDCDDSFDNAEAFGGGRFPTTVTIRYNRKASPPAFKGAVATDFEGCSNQRRIILKKKRPGRDRVVGRDLSNNKGNWAIAKRRARGRFYAIAPRKQFEANGATVICNRDESVTITVRR